LPWASHIDLQLHVFKSNSLVHFPVVANEHSSRTKLCFTGFRCVSCHRTRCETSLLVPQSTATLNDFPDTEGVGHSLVRPKSIYLRRNATFDQTLALIYERRFILVFCRRWCILQEYMHHRDLLLVAGEEAVWTSLASSHTLDHFALHINYELISIYEYLERLELGFDLRWISGWNRCDSSIAPLSNFEQMREVLLQLFTPTTLISSCRRGDTRLGR
jgi:hypothetical protein